MKTFLLAIAAFSVQASVGNAAIIYNGDFETGDLSGWNTFTTANGNLGSVHGLPAVTLFDTKGNGAFSDAATFMVGEYGFSGTYEGGGIYQTFSVSAGTYFVGADFAAQNPNLAPNASAGIATVFIDGSTIETLDFRQLIGGAPIQPGQIERNSFLTTVYLGAGSHQITIQFTRNYVTGTTPLQYVDNIQVSPVPEPSSAFLVLSTLLGFPVVRRLAFNQGHWH